MGLLNTLQLWTRDLRPGFEMMGNPSSHFTDFRDAPQVNLWREIVRKVVDHYVQRYGIGTFLKLSNWHGRVYRP